MVILTIQPQSPEEGEEKGEEPPKVLSARMSLDFSNPGYEIVCEDTTETMKYFTGKPEISLEVNGIVHEAHGLLLEGYRYAMKLGVYSKSVLFLRKEAFTEDVNVIVIKKEGFKTLTIRVSKDGRLLSETEETDDNKNESAGTGDHSEGTHPGDGMGGITEKSDSLQGGEESKNPGTAEVPQESGQDAPQVLGVQYRNIWISDKDNCIQLDFGTENAGSFLEALRKKETVNISVQGKKYKGPETSLYGQNLAYSIARGNGSSQYLRLTIDGFQEGNNTVTIKADGYKTLTLTISISGTVGAKESTVELSLSGN